MAPRYSGRDDGIQPLGEVRTQESLCPDKPAREAGFCNSVLSMTSALPLGLPTKVSSVPRRLIFFPGCSSHGRVEPALCQSRPVPSPTSLHRASHSSQAWASRSLAGHDLAWVDWTRRPPQSPSLP